MAFDRRTFLGTTAATGAAVALAGATSTPAAAQEGVKGPGPRTYSFTVMGTTDLHGNVFNWDYFTDKEFDDKAHNDVGLAKISTLVEQVRGRRGGATPC